MELGLNICVTLRKTLISEINLHKMFQFDWEHKHRKSDAYIMSSYQVVTWSCSSWSGPGSVVLFILRFFFGLLQLYLIDAMKKGQRQRGRHAAKGHGLD